MKKRILLTALAAALLTAAVVTAAATAGKRGHPGQAALRKQVATLRTQNKRLRQYSPAAIQQQLAKTKAALDKYQDVEKAKADGYALGSPCVMTPTDPGQTSYGGVMGVHFVNDAIMQSGKLDPAKPPILVYTPTKGGGFELVAAEYFKPDADQNTKTDDDRPSLFGRAFDGPMLGHSPGMPIHYDLHVWLWKHNPSGLFAPWNPDASCTP
jgi:hypothetical protein